MKLSQYAKQQGISYRTALRWWQAGLIKGDQAPTGTIIVAEDPRKEAHTVHRVVIYARVSFHEHRANLERQVQRLEDYCANRGYQLETLLALQGRTIEVVNLAENDREDEAFGSGEHCVQFRCLSVRATASQTENGSHCQAGEG